jgi:DNA-binding CsgD family transcriptional regulator
MRSDPGPVVKAEWWVKRRSDYKGTEWRKEWMRNWERKNRARRQEYMRDWRLKNREKRKLDAQERHKRTYKRTRPTFTPWQLTSKQMKYMRMLADGYEPVEIARMCDYYSRDAVKRTLSRAVDKLGCATIPQAIRKLAESSYFKKSACLTS